MGDRYLLSAEIGRGSTGVVWDGRDLTNGETVAVKILHATLLTSAAARGRFQREVASAQALDHPHSVRVKTHGQTPEGSEYLVMERLAGRTLGALLTEAGPLPQTRAIRIATQILDALSAAHRRNVIHRDLKPSNVILVDSDRERDFVKVCDFGLAKVFNPDADDDDPDDASGDFPSASTGQGELCGTPEYMAPEQARGEILDGRADLYSVAVMLFQAVVGQLPFRGKTPLAVISSHLGTPPPRPSDLRPDLGITAALENLILRGLAKDRRERPSSADVFRAELLQIQRDLLRDERRHARRRGRAGESATLPAASLATPGASSKRIVIGAAVAALGATILVTSLWTASSRRRHSASPPLSVEAESRAAAGSATPAQAESPGPAPPPPAPAASPRPDGRSMPRTTLDKGSRRPSGPRPSGAIGTQAPGIRSTVDVPTGEHSPPADAHAPPAVSADAEGIIQRAEDLLAEGQGAEACALGETAAARSPGLALVHGFLGRCYMRVGQAQTARASYRRYLELAPEAQDARFVRAIIEGKR